MKLGSSHLSYCTNIHAGETWDEVRGNLERYLPPVKARVSPGAPFGVGLRLSAEAADSLQCAATRARFAAFLRDEDLYVFTINGFPYGTFHGARVKADVYLPDWRDARRLEYTNRLAELLAGWVRPDAGTFGSISTVPGAFKPNAATPDAVGAIVDGLIRHASRLVSIERETGQRIVLALEPEPCCMLETIAETVEFFRLHLHSDAAAARLATLSGLAPAAAQDALRRHLGVCLDLCHAAVEFEEPATCLEALQGAGITIAKIQVTAGLRLPRVDADTVAALRKLEDSVYLHQVVERGARGLRRYADIDEACAAQRWSRGDCEWRVHFHVPVFLEELSGCSSTQPFVRDVLALHRRRPASPHLEVETYTWSVLPAHLRNIPVDEAIARELHWVAGELA